MPLTPDRFPGEEDVEGLIFEAKPSDPSIAGGLRYVGGRFRARDSQEVFGFLFGRNFQNAVSEAESSTSASTYQEKATLTTPALTGHFRIGGQAVVSTDAGNKDVWFRLYNETDDDVIEEGTARPAVAGRPFIVNGFRIIEFTGSAKTFKIQWRREPGNPSYGATIKQARIEIWRVY